MALSGSLLAFAVGLACEEAPEESGLKVLSKPIPAAKAKGPPPPDPAIWETAQSDPDLEAGRRVWVGTCIACHSTGLGGAPLIGNRELWGPRIAQGVEVLVEHATNGFYGKKGEMPARGGNEALSDDQVRRAVVFMASRAM